MKKLIVLLMFAVVAPLKAQHAEPQKWELAFLSKPDSPSVFEYRQHAQYKKWWAEIALCEQLPLPSDYVNVHFFEVNAPTFRIPELPDAWLDGVTYPLDNEIYLAATMVDNEEVAKHEMLHWLLKRAGYEFKGFHPAEFFEVCGVHRYGP